MTRQERAAWYWPVRVLIILLAIVIAGVVLALIFSGCSAQPGSSGYNPPDDPGNVGTSTDTQGMEERHIRLSDGREIVCITWVDSGYQYENTASGISCDWTEVPE